MPKALAAVQLAKNLTLGALTLKSGYENLVIKDTSHTDAFRGLLQKLLVQYNIVYTPVAKLGLTKKKNSVNFFYFPKLSDRFTTIIYRIISVK